MSIDLAARLQEGALSARKTPEPPAAARLVPLRPSRGEHSNGSATGDHGSASPQVATERSASNGSPGDDAA
jgi:hypothetical protein